MEEVSLKDAGPPCPLCGSSRIRPKTGYVDMDPDGWALCACSACATAFLNPMPSFDTLRQYYDTDYYGDGQGKFPAPAEGVVRLFRYVRARAIQRLAPAGTVLDVGCGRGLMLKYLKRWGYDVHGVELDTVAARRARNNLGQRVSHSLGEAAAELTKPCDVICFWHSLEHMPEPGKALRAADRLLAPGGLLVISAPHMGSLQSRLAGPHWLHLDLPRHVVHFDMNRLATYLQATGYRCIRHQHVSQEYNPIDTLCHLYHVLGFDPLYPFHLLRGAAHRHKACRPFQVLKAVLGLSLLLPLAGEAFFIANVFSLLRSGSTETLFLRKCAPADRQTD